MAALEHTAQGSGNIHTDGDGVRRRDFINVAAVSFAGVGAVAAVVPLLSQMAPSVDVLALASTEVDISKIAPGQAIKTVWRKQPQPHPAGDRRGQQGLAGRASRPAVAGRADQAG